MLRFKIHAALWKIRETVWLDLAQMPVSKLWINITKKILKNKNFPCASFIFLNLVSLGQGPGIYCFCTRIWIISLSCFLLLCNEQYDQKCCIIKIFQLTQKGGGSSTKGRGVLFQRGGLVLLYRQHNNHLQVETGNGGSLNYFKKASEHLKQTS